MEGQSHGWGEGSMEAWEGLHNTKVGVSGCMCAIRQGVGGGGGKGELKKRGIGVCLQNTKRLCMGKQKLPTTNL